MKQLGYLLLFLYFLLFLSCKDSKPVKTPHEPQKTNSKHKTSWSYQGETGPEHWAEIEKNSDCDGKHQSPVNIINKDVLIDPSTPKLQVHFESSTIIENAINNGHSIQYNFKKGDFITVDDEKFELIQIHFHEPAEHTINGVRYPVEMHMVHASKSNKIAVLSIFAEEGEASKPFDFLESYLPLAKGEIKEINKPFDLNLNLPENKSYYYYNGSLTTPPCTENVAWFVFKNNITISVDQVIELQKLMPINNYRNEQPLNGRVVKSF